MCHLPYNCHLHSQWDRLRHTEVACHIHVSFAPALTETRRSGSLFFLVLFHSNETFGAKRDRGPLPKRQCQVEFQATRLAHMEGFAGRLAALAVSGVAPIPTPCSSSPAVLGIRATSRKSSSPALLGAGARISRIRLLVKPTRAVTPKPLDLAEVLAKLDTAPDKPRSSDAYDWEVRTRTLDRSWWSSRIGGRSLVHESMQQSPRTPQAPVWPTTLLVFRVDSLRVLFWRRHRSVAPARTLPPSPQCFPATGHEIQPKRWTE